MFFDLPVGTAKQRREYVRFRKFLEKSGYLMMQESVYAKLAINERVASGLIGKLRENKPPEGLVQVLKITERQYETIEYIVGAEIGGGELETTDELVIL